MDRGAWRATVRGVAKSQARLKRLSTHTQCKTGFLKSSKDHTGKVDGGLSEPPGLAIRPPLPAPQGFWRTACIITHRSSQSLPPHPRARLLKIRILEV